MEKLLHIVDELKKILDRKIEFPYHSDFKEWLKDAMIQMLDEKRLAGDSDWQYYVAQALDCGHWGVIEFSDGDKEDHYEYKYSDFLESWAKLIDSLLD